MPHRVTAFQPTPNPNALKCILDTPLPEGVRSFRSREEAAADPLAAALFAIPGVTSVLLSGEWLTVNKSPQSEWALVKKGIEAALRNA